MAKKILSVTKFFNCDAVGGEVRERLNAVINIPVAFS